MSFSSLTPQFSSKSSAAPMKSAPQSQSSISSFFGGAGVADRHRMLSPPNVLKPNRISSDNSPRTRRAATAGGHAGFGSALSLGHKRSAAAASSAAIINPLARSGGLSEESTAAVAAAESRGTLVRFTLCNSCTKPVHASETDAEAETGDNRSAAPTGQVLCSSCLSIAHRSCAEKDVACLTCRVPFQLSSSQQLPLGRGAVYFAARRRRADDDGSGFIQPPRPETALTVLNRSRHHHQQYLSAIMSTKNSTAECASCRGPLSSAKKKGAAAATAALASGVCGDCQRALRQGDYCRLCCRAYGADDVAPMVNCELCEEWVHIECDNISVEAYLAMAEDQELYACPFCRYNRPGWASELCALANGNTERSSSSSRSARDGKPKNSESPPADTSALDLSNAAIFDLAEAAAVVAQASILSDETNASEMIRIEHRPSVEPCDVFKDIVSNGERGLRPVFISVNESRALAAEKAAAAAAAAASAAAADTRNAGNLSSSTVSNDNIQPIQQAAAAATAAAVVGAASRSASSSQKRPLSSSTSSSLDGKHSQVSTSVSLMEAKMVPFKEPYLQSLVEPEREAQLPNTVASAHHDCCMSESYATVASKSMNSVTSAGTMRAGQRVPKLSHVSDSDELDLMLTIDAQLANLPTDEPHETESSRLLAKRNRLLLAHQRLEAGAEHVAVAPKEETPLPRHSRGPLKSFSSDERRTAYEMPQAVMALPAVDARAMLSVSLCNECGSGGGALLTCADCGETHHSYCVGVNTPIARMTASWHATWRCPHCKTCSRCGSVGEEQLLLVCDICDDAKHTICCQPPLDHVPDDDVWACDECKSVISHFPEFRGTATAVITNGEGGPESETSASSMAPQSRTPSSSSASSSLTRLSVAAHLVDAARSAFSLASAEAVCNKPRQHARLTAVNIVETLSDSPGEESLKAQPKIVGEFFSASRPARESSKPAPEASFVKPPPSSSSSLSSHDVASSQGGHVSDPRRCAICRINGDQAVQGRLLPMLPKQMLNGDAEISLLGDYFGGEGDMEEFDDSFVEYLSAALRGGSGAAVDDARRRLREVLASKRTSDHLTSRHHAHAILSTAGVCWVHARCALWSPEVDESEAGELTGVRETISRSARLRCHHCQRTGASIGCYSGACQKTFHFHCALAAGCRFRWKSAGTGVSTTSPSMAGSGSCSAFYENWPSAVSGSRSVHCYSHSGGAVPPANVPQANDTRLLSSDSQGISIRKALSRYPASVKYYEYQEQRGPFAVGESRRAQVNGALIEDVGLCGQDSLLFQLTSPLFSTARFLYCSTSTSETASLQAAAAAAAANAALSSKRLSLSERRRNELGLLRRRLMPWSAETLDQFLPLEDQPSSVALAASVVSRALTVRGVRDADSDWQMENFEDLLTELRQFLVHVSDTRAKGSQRQSIGDGGELVRVGEEDFEEDEEAFDSEVNDSSHAGTSVSNGSENVVLHDGDDDDDRPRRRRKTIVKFVPDDGTGKVKGMFDAASAAVADEKVQGDEAKPRRGRPKGSRKRPDTSKQFSSSTSISPLKSRRKASLVRGASSSSDSKSSSSASRANSASQSGVMSDSAAPHSLTMATHIAISERSMLDQLGISVDQKRALYRWLLAESETRGLTHNLSVRLGALTLVTLGSLKTRHSDRGKGTQESANANVVAKPLSAVPAHDAFCLYPLGFRAYRLYWSTLTPLLRRVFVFFTERGDPLRKSGTAESTRKDGSTRAPSGVSVSFVIQELTSSEATAGSMPSSFSLSGNQPSNLSMDDWSGLAVVAEFRGATVEEAWRQVVSKVDLIRERASPSDSAPHGSNVAVEPMSELLSGREEQRKKDVGQHGAAKRSLRERVRLALLATSDGTISQRSSPSSPEGRIVQSRTLHGLLPSDYFGLSAPPVTASLEHLPNAWRVAYGPLQQSKYRFLYRAIYATAQWLRFPGELWQAFMTDEPGSLNKEKEREDQRSSTDAAMSAVALWRQRKDAALKDKVVEQRAVDTSLSSACSRLSDAVRCEPIHVIHKLIEIGRSERSSMASISSSGFAGTRKRARLAGQAAAAAAASFARRTESTSAAALGGASIGADGSVEPSAAMAAAAAAAAALADNGGVPESAAAAAAAARIASVSGGETYIPMAGRMMPVVSAYREMQLLLRATPPRVRVQPSRIHGLGAVLGQAVAAHEMIIEYAGELIRQAVADIREQQYDSRGIGCYMFRVDDDLIVDATMIGNAARFINHSCDPNCFTKIMDVHGTKKILLFARRPIAKDVELTYDYSFAIEDDENKIPCHCGAFNCRRFMN